MEMQQRSAEWIAARLGKITSSRFKDVLAKPQVKGAGVAETYMDALAWETIGRVPQHRVISRAMQHGINCEPKARRYYEQATGRKVEEVGFVQHPTERLVGCSPDGLVGDDGIIEIKCPVSGAIHAGYVRHGPVAHKAQIQGILWITGRKWCDFISYHSHTPDLKLALHIVPDYRDEEYIERLASAVRNFRARLEETVDRLNNSFRQSTAGALRERHQPASPEIAAALQAAVDAYQE